jgi:hypothetical protein
MSKRTIPELRDALLDVATRLDLLHQVEAREIREIVEEMFRDPPARGRCAPVTHRRLTGGEKQRIADYAFAHPNVHLQDIAVRFNTNTGRVSEALKEFVK